MLDARPDDVIATLSLGHVLAAQASWEDAMALFDKAAAAAEADDTPAGQRRLQEAREESAWCKAKSGRVDEGRVELEAILSELDAEAAEGAVSSERDATRGARVAWRLGSCLADLSGSERDPLIMPALFSQPANAWRFPSCRRAVASCARPLPLGPQAVVLVCACLYLTRHLLRLALASGHRPVVALPAAGV